MSEHLDRIGKQIGEYRLVKWLGSGGFGHIYLAEQIIDRKVVAVKLFDRLNQSDDLKLFLNEARTIRLQHPHIVPILDFGISRDEYPYLVMEYAEGGSLRALFPKGMLVPLQIIKGYVLQVASALQYAHDRRLIHRDVKPENILMRRDGSVLLSDFGMAIAAYRTLSRADSQNIGGTMPYMAPESVHGQPSFASDQYSLGIVVYEWLAGRRPFDGTPQEVAIHQVMTPPPSLRAMVPSLDPMIDEVIRIALAKDPEKRFASVQAFGKALEQASQEVVAAQPLFSEEQQVSQPSQFSSASAFIPTLPVSPSSLPISVQTSLPVPVLPQVVLPATLPPQNPPMQEQFLQQQMIQTPPPQMSGGPWSYPGAPVISTAGPPVRPRVSTRYILFSILLALLVAGGSVATYAFVNIDIQRRAQDNANATATADKAHLLATQIPLTATAVIKNKEQAAIAAYNENVAKNGTMFGVDAQRTNFNPYEYLLRKENGARLDWTKTISTPTESAILSPPVADDKKLYVGDQKGFVYAFDATSGAQLWQASTGDACLKDQQVVQEQTFCVSTPAVVKGLVYVCSENRLFILDATTGTQKWASPANVKLICDEPTVTGDGIVYFRYHPNNDSDRVYALDGATLTVRWVSAQIATTETFTTDPVLGNSLVYVGSQSGKLYAFDATMTGAQPVGALKWAVPTGTTIFPFSSPVVTQKTVYITADDSRLYALDALLGAVQWTTPVIGSAILSPAVSNAFVYLYVGSPTAGQKANLYAFDPATGQQKWVTSTGAFSQAATPEVAGDLIYVTPTDGMLYVFDALTGQKLRTSTSLGAFPTDPTIANGKVYVGSTGGKIFVFSVPEKETASP